VSIQTPQRCIISIIRKLRIAYELNSPIFKELLSNLTNNPINQETQIKIEYILPFGLKPFLSPLFFLYKKN